MSDFNCEIISHEALEEIAKYIGGYELAAILRAHPVPKSLAIVNESASEWVHEFPEEPERPCRCGSGEHW